MLARLLHFTTGFPSGKGNREDRETRLRNSNTHNHRWEVIQAIFKAAPVGIPGQADDDAGEPVVG
jgi:hypothetical protein